MATTLLVPCTDENLPGLLYKAKQIIAEGECDCDCTKCPGVFICRDPDSPPYTMLREFLERNEHLQLQDYALNNQVNTENLNLLGTQDTI